MTTIDTVTTEDEVQDLDIIEFTEDFNYEWLNNKFRASQLYGGIDEHAITLRAGGYVLPQTVNKLLEPHIMHTYLSLAGDYDIIDTQEVYDTVVVNGVKYVRVRGQAMVTTDNIEPLDHLSK